MADTNSPEIMTRVTQTLASIRRRTGCGRRRARWGLTAHGYEAASRYSDDEIAKGLVTMLLAPFAAKGVDPVGQAKRIAGDIDPDGTPALTLTVDEGLTEHLEGRPLVAILGIAEASPLIDRIVAEEAEALFAWMWTKGFLSDGIRAGAVIGLIAMTDFYEYLESDAGGKLPDDYYDEAHPLVGPVAMTRAIADERLSRGERVPGLAGWTPPAPWRC